MKINKKYRFDELKIGMRVRKSQLSEIYNKSIILKDIHTVEDNDVEGIIAQTHCISSDIHRIADSKNTMMLVYNKKPVASPIFAFDTM